MLRLIPVLIVLAALARVGTNSIAVDPLPALPAIDSTIESVAAPSSGVIATEYQVFDPTVVFAALPGVDGMPGVAGADDNMNGVIDDRAELGATRSDDQCAVLTAEQLAASSEQDVMVLQRGAFVAGEDPDNVRPHRAFVFGKSADGRLWSMLLDLTETLRTEK